MSKESKESPIVSFRVPYEVVQQLIEQGKIPQDYTKSDLSNLIKNEWLASIGSDVPVVLTASDVSSKLDAILKEIEILKGESHA